MEEIIRRIVKPSDCALVFGLPIEKRDFLRDLESGKSKDWVKFYQSWHGGYLAEPLWDDHYLPRFVKPALETAELLRQFHGTVYSTCRLTDLAGILDRHAVVTLVSHWRSPDVREYEIADAVSFMA